MPQTTQHTHQIIFGRKEAGCPRCAELVAGAAPIRWSGTTRRATEAAQMAAIRAHRCATAGCGPVCTFGDW